MTLFPRAEALWDSDLLLQLSLSVSRDPALGLTGDLVGSGTHSFPYQNHQVERAQARCCLTMIYLQRGLRHSMREVGNMCTSEK